VLKTRALSALILGVPVIVAIVAGGIWTTLVVLIVISLMMIEYTHLVARMGHRAFGALLVLWGALFVADRALPDTHLAETGTAILLIASAAWAIVRYRQGTANAFTGFAMTIAGGVYIGWSAAHFVEIRLMDDGLYWFLTVLLSTWGTDTFAYLIGRAIGRHKLIPDVSPGKTWEGYVGALLVTPPVIAAFMLLWQRLGASAAVAPVHGCAIAFLVALISPIGDLLISMLKRTVNAKDASQLIPGHGGFLDRADALLVAVLLGYYYLAIVVR
jgi:phosphatidate cytidylyltransferase